MEFDKNSYFYDIFKNRGIRKKRVKNSYFRAILKATSNGKFPEYSDLWRCFHPTACMLDSDYCLFSDSGRISTTRHEEEKPAGVSPKKLYVPVTRKVSLTDETKSQKLH